MLRASRKISVRSKTMQVYDGMLIAPVININGLILASIQPIPSKIKEFLESKGAKVGRVRINDEIFVKLSGEFNITAQEVSIFLAENPEFVIDESQLKEVVAVKFQSSMEVDLQKKKLESGPLTFRNQRASVRVSVSRLSTEARSNITAGSSVVLTGTRAHAATDTEMTAGKEIVLSGQELGELDVSAPVTVTADGVSREEENDSIRSSTGCHFGYMAEISSLQRTIMRSKRQTSIENSVVDAGEIRIETGDTGNFRVVIDRGCVWVNEPYSSHFTPLYSTRAAHCDIDVTTLAIYAPDASAAAAAKPAGSPKV